MKFFGELEMSVRESFKLYSQRLNVFVTVGVIPYLIASNGGVIASIVDSLPSQYRILIAPLAGVLAFAIVTWARLKVQPKQDD